MSYNGYAARIEYSDEERFFVGRIAGIRDVVGFYGESVKELRAAFEEAIDDYLDTCAKLGWAPQKPYSGKLSLRLEPELHASVALRAEIAQKSINQWVTDVLNGKRVTEPPPVRAVVTTQRPESLHYVLSWPPTTEGNT